MNIKSQPAGHCAEPTCQRPFKVPPCALNKRFCSASCRDRYHSRERADAIAHIRATRQPTANHGEMK